MKCLFLCNPSSGKGDIARQAPAVCDRLSEKYEVECVFAESPAEMTAHVRETDCKVVVFAGGDGTFHRVLQAAAEKEVTLGYLPAGTMNDIARSAGIPRSLRGALSVVEGGRTERFDCMKIGNEYCMYLAAAGSAVRLSYRTPPALKRRWGKLAYWIYGVRHCMDFRPFPVEIAAGEETLKTVAAAVFLLNGRVAAGCPVNREGSMRDGRAELAVLESGSKGRELAALTGFLLGGKQRLGSIDTLRGAEFSIAVPPDVVWDFDGEEGTKGSIRARVLPRRIAMFAPPRKKI